MAGVVDPSVVVVVDGVVARRNLVLPMQHVHHRSTLGLFSVFESKGLDADCPTP